MSLRFVTIDTKCDFLRKRLLGGDGRVSHWGVLLKVGALLNIVTLICEGEIDNLSAERS